MVDLEFTEQSGIWGMRISNGDLVKSSGADEVGQNSKIRLQIVAGELYDDTSKGVPWLTDMVDNRVSIEAKKQIIRRVILSTPGVKSLDVLDVVVDDETGIAHCEFLGKTKIGEVFSAKLN